MGILGKDSAQHGYVVMDFGAVAVGTVTYGKFRRMGFEGFDLPKYRRKERYGNVLDVFLTFCMFRETMHANGRL